MTKKKSDGDCRDGFGFDHSPLDETVRQALVSMGWLFPITEEDVARAEAEFHESAVEVPSELLNVDAVLDGSLRRSTGVGEGTPQLEAGIVEQNLARAARDGGEIPAEIEELMRRDRDNAESQLNQ